MRWWVCPCPWGVLRGEKEAWGPLLNNLHFVFLFDTSLIENVADLKIPLQLWYFVVFSCFQPFLYLCSPDRSFLVFSESLFLLRGCLLTYFTFGLITVIWFCSLWVFVSFVLLLLSCFSIHIWPISNFQGFSYIYLDFHMTVIINYL